MLLDIVRQKCGVLSGGECSFCSLVFASYLWLVGSALKVCILIGLCVAQVMRQLGSGGPVRDPRFSAWHWASRSACSCFVVFMIVFICMQYLVCRGVVSGGALPLSWEAPADLGLIVP